MVRKKTTKKRKTSTSTTKKTKKRSKRTWSTDAYAEKLVIPVAQALGLDILGFDEEMLKELLKDIIIASFGDVISKPSVETIVKRFMRNSDKVLSIVASRVLERIPEGKLTPEQLEFVVMYIGPAILPWASRLYREIKKMGLEELLPNLQSMWEEGWRLRGEMGPVAYCPKCGFRSVTPDLSCMVCGHVLTERELKGSIKFGELLKKTVETLDCATLRKLSERGIVYLTHSGIELERVTKWDIEVPLSKSEKEIIMKALKERCESSEEKRLQELLSKVLSS